MVRNLLAPPVPVMFDIVSPDISLVTDSLFNKQVRQAVGIAQAFLFPGPLAAD